MAQCVATGAVGATASRVLGALNQVRRLPLDRHAIELAQLVARRIVHEESDVPKVGVAAFGSFI